MNSYPKKTTKYMKLIQINVKNKKKPILLKKTFLDFYLNSTIINIIFSYNIIQSFKVFQNM